MMLKMFAHQPGVETCMPASAMDIEDVNSSVSGKARWATPAPRRDAALVEAEAPDTNAEGPQRSAAAAKASNRAGSKTRRAAIFKTCKLGRRCARSTGEITC